MDFASDKKKEKKTARRMLEMTATINSDYLGRFVTRMNSEGPKPAVPDLGDGAVHCLTCHRGQQKPPRPLDAGLYDFRDMTLLSVVRRLRDEKKLDQSLAFAKARRGALR